MCDVQNIGAVNKKMLTARGLPLDILDHGTVVQFRLREGTHIPQEEQILAKVSGFYMLRLIAADPNTEVELARKSSQGVLRGTLRYDFPVGKILLRVSDKLDLGEFGSLPVEIFSSHGPTSNSLLTRLTSSDERMVFCS